ncbi:cellulase family glycosylhydrolase [bacterium]|nr:cellulase family glycosylhydrolase [bacterium]
MIDLRGDYFYRDGKPFWPIGFNYWPSRTGVHCWKIFDRAEWDEDFKAMREAGFNTVRMFLLWEDFQPEEERVDEEKLGRLREVCEVADEHELLLIPTLFQGWMSGTNFDPAWRKGRNHVRDRQLRGAMVRLARAVAETLKEAGNILAIDLANEINVICPDVDEESIESWTSDLAEAIRQGRPGTVVMNGVGSFAFSGRSKWTYPAQKVDVHSMHGYPVFSTPLQIGRLGGFRATTLFGHMTAFPRAFGPVMRQEFGTAIGGEGLVLGDFVKASCMATWLAGANGFLYWCWRDFTSKELPYRKDPFEASLGYVDGDLRKKEWARGFDAFRDFLYDNGGLVPARPGVAIYISRRVKQGGASVDAILAACYENLIANGLQPVWTAEIRDDYSLLIVPYGDLEVDEIEALDGYVSRGGKLIVSGLSFRTCSRYWEELSGTRMGDLLRCPQGYDLIWGSDHYELEGGLYGENPYPVMQAVGEDVRVLLKMEDIPVAFSRPRGEGAFVQFAFPLVSTQSTGVDTALLAFWRRLIEASGYEPPFRISPWFCQAGLVENEAGEQKVLVVNHSSHSTVARVRWVDRVVEVELGSRCFELVSRSDG